MESGAKRQDRIKTPYGLLIVVASLSLLLGVIAGYGAKTVIDERAWENLFESLSEPVEPLPVPGRTWLSFSPRIIDLLASAKQEDTFSKLSAFRARMGVSAFTVKQTDKDVQVSGQLRGFDSRDLQLTVSGDLLQIKGTTRERQGDGDNALAVAGSFERVISLPTHVDAAQGKARLIGDALTIIFPKANVLNTASVRIPVNGSQVPS